MRRLLLIFFTLAVRYVSCTYSVLARTHMVIAAFGDKSGRTAPVEVVYCSNCGFQIAADAQAAGAAVLSDDGKVYCAKCAPLYEHTTSSLLAIQLPISI